MLKLPIPYNSLPTKSTIPPSTWYRPLGKHLLIPSEEEEDAHKFSLLRNADGVNWEHDDFLATSVFTEYFNVRGASWHQTRVNCSMDRRRRKLLHPPE